MQVQIVKIGSLHVMNILHVMIGIKHMTILQLILKKNNGKGFINYRKSETKKNFIDKNYNYYNFLFIFYYLDLLIL